MLGESPASNVPSGSLVSMLPVVFLACTNIPLNISSDSTVTAKVYFYILTLFRRTHCNPSAQYGQKDFKLRTKRVA